MLTDKTEVKRSLKTMPISYFFRVRERNGQLKPEERIFPDATVIIFPEFQKVRFLFKTFAKVDVSFQI